MAITIDDFSKIWASTSPLTPYEFSENNYKQGWNFVGGTPPSRQMWDFLQKQNDEKLKYLLDNFDNYLPLSGGTMTGDISIGSQALIKKTNDSGNLTLCGGSSASGSKGAKLDLCGADNPEDGAFVLQAGNENGYKQLVGKPNGSITWDGKEVVTKKDENISSQVTVTSNNGTVSEINFHKVGNVVAARFAITLTSAVNAGGTISGTITGAPANVSYSSGAGYIGSSALIMALNGLDYNIRVVGSNLSAGTAFAMIFTYVTVS